MSSTEAHALTLAPHPSAPSNVVRAVGVRVARSADGTLNLVYCVEGDASRMRLPPTRPARRVDGLWRHTCFEAFIAPDPGPAYLELNFSPSGEWASYAFSAYRTGMAAAEDIDTPRIAATLHERGLTVDVAVDLSGLAGGVTAKIAIAAIIEESNGSLSYWAIEHPSDKPDFHHVRGFALRI
jgi:hypothetical protein